MLIFILVAFSTFIAGANIPWHQDINMYMKTAYVKIIDATDTKIYWINVTSATGNEAGSGQMAPYILNDGSVYRLNDVSVNDFIVKIVIGEYANKNYGSSKKALVTLVVDGSRIENIEIQDETGDTSQSEKVTLMYSTGTVPPTSITIIVRESS